MYKTNKLQGANGGNSDGEGRLAPMENDDPSLGLGGGGGGGLASIAPLPATNPIHPTATPVGVTFLPNETMPSVDAMNSDPQLAADTAFGNQGGRASGNFTKANGLRGVRAGSDVY